jgi:hypothetical protein
MKLSLIARNILQEAAANPGGIRLTHSKTLLLLEDRGAITRSEDMVQITAAGLDMLEGKPPARKKRKAAQADEALAILRRELIQSRHEAAQLRRELETARSHSLASIGDPS